MDYACVSTSQTPDFNLNVPFKDEGVLEQQKEKFNEGRWTDAEHKTFVEGLEIHGKEWKKIAKLIPSRSIVQIRTHAQKYFQKVARDNYEKRGIQVPDTLKSTAIRSSYNFDALQVALNENTGTKVLGDNAGDNFTSCPQESSSSTAGSRKVEKPKPRRRSKSKSSARRKSQPKVKPIPKQSEMALSTGSLLLNTHKSSSGFQREPRRSRRSSRKSSKFSVDLQALTLNTSDDEQEEVFKIEDDLAFGNVGIGTSLENFSFTANHFSDEETQQLYHELAPDENSLSFSSYMRTSFRGGANVGTIKKAKSCGPLQFRQMEHFTSRGSPPPEKSTEVLEPLIDFGFVDDGFRILESESEQAHPADQVHGQQYLRNFEPTPTVKEEGKYLDGIAENGLMANCSETTSTNSLSVQNDFMEDPFAQFGNYSFGNALEDF